jgi:transposase
MGEIIRIVVGLDVHKKTIVVAVLYPGMSQVSERFTIENTTAGIEKMVKRLRERGTLSFCYEAGPCGYEVYRQLTRLGQTCVVIAPSMTPQKPGDRVKTDRRDAEKLARYFRSGELTEVRVPSVEEEGARDVVRVREDALEDQQRMRHRLAKFLLRQGRVYAGGKQWTQRHRRWLQGQRFEVRSTEQTYQAYTRMLEEAEERLRVIEAQVMALAEQPAYREMVRSLCSLKGVAPITGLTLAVETQDFQRFGRASSYMGFTGLVSSESSSGERQRRGAITRTGNSRIRRVLVEAAWHARHKVTVTGEKVQKRREGCSAGVLRIARRAEERLHRRYWHLVNRGKKPQVAAVACARELAGFVWSIANEVSRTSKVAA